MVAKDIAPFSAGKPVVICAKGVEEETGKLMSDVVQQILPDAIPAVLSGPSFAGEVARKLPAALTLACKNEELGRQSLLRSAISHSACTGRTILSVRKSAAR